MNSSLPRALRDRGQVLRLVVTAAGILLAASMLGFVVWSLTTRSPSLLAWQTSMATIWALALTGWGIAAGLLTWALRPAARETAGDATDAGTPGTTTGMQASYRGASHPPGPVAAARAGPAGDPSNAANYFSGDAVAVIQVSGTVYGDINVENGRQHQGPLGWPVREVADPFMLEVHRPIEVPVQPGVPGLPALPAYAEREHDRRLRASVARAIAGHSAMVVLVGKSSTGKTRACWEAIQALPAHWRVWHPIDPGRPEAAVEAIGRIGPHTVVWLNDTHHYLLTPGSNLGERLAAGLRELLRSPDRSPVLVLGTLWPEYWAALTSEPAPGSRDPHAQARLLLAGVDIPVPGAFTGPDLTAIQAAARADPRLAEACGAAGGRITQYLAGVPLLLERYRNAPDAAKAVIEAAIDARRLGHGLRLSEALLAAMAPCYLSDEQWDVLGQDWFRSALAYAAIPCRGVRGPLTLIRPRPGQPGASEPGYRLSDYLEQTGRTDRRHLAAPAAVWKALAVHGDRRDLGRIAAEAERRALYRDAFALSSTGTGHLHDLCRAATLLERAAGPAATLDWLEERVKAGDTSALGPAASLRQRSGRTAEALAYYRRAATAGHLDAVFPMRDLLCQHGHTDEALGWLLRFGHAGGYYALIAASDILEQTGRTGEALAALERSAAGGHPQAQMLAAELVQRTAGIGDAVRWLESRAESGGAKPLIQAAVLLRRAGQMDDALTFYQRAAKAGDVYALRRAAEMLERVGRVEEALTWYRRAGETGDVSALRHAADLLRREGRPEEALACYRQGTQAGDPEAACEAANLLTEMGRPREALTWLRESNSAHEHPRVLTKAGELLEEAGSPDEALRCYRAAVRAGDPRALSKATWLLEKTGRIDEALTWLTDLADAGIAGAYARGANMLERAGRAEEAIIWYQRSNDVGWAANLMEAAGRTEETVTWLLTCAEAGIGHALTEVIRLLEDTGRTDEAGRLRRYGIEPGGQIASRWGAKTAGLRPGSGPGVFGEETT